LWTSSGIARVGWRRSHFALASPARVQRLVLACTGAGGPSYMHAPGAICRRGHADYLALRRAGAALTARRPPGSCDVHARRHRRRVVGGPVILRPDAHLDRRLVGSGAPARLSPALARGTAPTLMLAGRWDPQMPPACAVELTGGIPGAQLVVFERSGHYPIREGKPPLGQCGQVHRVGHCQHPTATPGGGWRVDRRNCSCQLSPWRPLTGARGRARADRSHVGATIGAGGRPRSSRGGLLEQRKDGAAEAEQLASQRKG
jgi:hypothetical protein